MFGKKSPERITTVGYDPKRKVHLKATNDFYLDGKVVHVGERFEVEAQFADDILSTKRADFVNQADRGLVYKKVFVW